MKHKTTSPKSHFLGWSFLLGIIIILNIPFPAKATEEYRFERVLPTLRQPWYFDAPAQAIAVDGRGFVYLADAGADAWNHHCIQKFTSDGQFVTKWGSYGSGDGEFNVPSGIAVDGSGFVYVAESGNCRIQKFTPDGQFVAKWGSEGSGDGEFYVPHGIAVDGSGFVYVTDTYNYRIQKFTSDGRFVAKWGSWKDREVGEFDDVSGIAVDGSGFVYVGDTYSVMDARIQKFTPHGQFVTQWGSYGDGDGQFYEPYGIAVDGSGFVYVTDGGHSRIQKFTSDGQFVAKWGSEGSGDGEFSGTFGIAVDGSGFVYVADSSHSRIQKFTSDGQFVAKWGSEGSRDGEFNLPFGIAADGSGFVYVLDAGNDRIQKFTSDGQFVAKWGSEGSGDGEFWGPFGIAADGSGFVYVADKYNDRIQKFTAGGQFITKFGSSGAELGRLNWPRGLAIDEAGRVFVTDTENHRVQVFKPVTRISNNKAIIVAGGGPYQGNNLWDSTQMCANFAYRTLTYQGFTKESIYYLTSDTDLDLDSNGVLDDVDGDATTNNLQQAIINWASSADDVILYLIGPGGDGFFRMNATETLSASQLDSWLDQMQQTIFGKVTAIYDACESGSFLPSLTPPVGKQRITIASTSPGESAYFVTQGSISFSNYFWNHIFNGLAVYDAFNLTRQAIGQISGYQNPLLDGNGNGIGNEAADEVLARTTYIGNGTVIPGEAPVIGGVSPAQTINGASSALLYADNVTDADGIARVWAVITPPGFSSSSPDTPVTDLPILEMNLVGGNRYQGTSTAFTEPGTYNVAIFAMDRNGIISLPKQTTVSQQVPLNVSALATDLTGSPAVNTPVTITFTAQGSTSGNLYYQYLLASGYQTQNYGNWQILKDYSNENFLTWSPTTDDHYVIVAYVAQEMNSQIFHQAGLSIETQGNSASPIQITELTTTMGYPQSTGTAITLDTTATGGNGQLYYKYWYCKGIGGTRNVIRDYSTSSSCTWTPNEDGFYTVVVWVSDNQSETEYSIAGMTCTIGD
ncbi:MAG: C13 family peptidase [Pseudomonadota bacterium]